MEDTPKQSAESSSLNLKAAKDKECLFCHQAFTASSLGRHYDNYIKLDKPKPPDDKHNEEAIVEIRKIRADITRRQPKGSLSRQGTSVSGGTPVDISKKASSSDAESPSVFQSPLSARGGGDRPQIGREFPFNTPWEATGVINDTATNGQDAGHGPRNRRPGLPFGWTNNKDKDPKTQDLEDRARAAELALRELISSFRAAKQHIDMDSTPFDFDPLELDFTALVLQCLEPPAALLASMPTPTPTSWSLDPPGPKELEALKGYFQEAFRKWKISCAAATTAVGEDLAYPPPQTLPKIDPIDSIRKAEKKAEDQEKRVAVHIMSTYQGWNNTPPAQRELYWKLELARGVLRKQKQVDKLKDVEHTLRQENENLKAQYQYLSRLQQPREYKIQPPTTIPFDPKLVSYLAEESVVHNKRGVGLNLGDRHSDLNTIVSRSIDRWKGVILSTRPESIGSLKRKVDTGEPETGTTVKRANVSTNQVQIQGQGQGQAKPPQPQHQQVQQQAQQPQSQPQYQQVQQHPQLSPPLPLPHGLPQQSQSAFEGFPQANTASEGTQPSTRNSATVSPADPDADDDDDDESSDGDADKDGEVDEDADGDSEADADADAEMEDGSAYNNADSEMDDGGAYNTMGPPLTGSGASQQQQHTLLAQQQHQQGNQVGAIRTRPSGAQGRFSPLQTNSNPTARSATGGSAIHTARGSNNNMHLMNRAVSGNNNMAGLGGVHQQYLNGHMASIDPGRGGLGVGHSMGNNMDDPSQRMGVPSQGGVRSENMYTN